MGSLGSHHVGGLLCGMELLNLDDLSRNLLAVLMLIGAFFVIAQGQARSLKAWPFLIGLLIGLAGLFHTLTVFAVPSICYFLWKHAEQGKRVSTFVAAALASAITVSPSIFWRSFTSGRYKIFMASEVVLRTRGC